MNFPFHPQWHLVQHLTIYQNYCQSCLTGLITNLTSPNFLQWCHLKIKILLFTISNTADFIINSIKLKHASLGVYKYFSDQAPANLLDFICYYFFIHLEFSILQNDAVFHKSMFKATLKFQPSYSCPLPHPTHPPRKYQTVLLSPSSNSIIETVLLFSDCLYCFPTGL